LDRPGVGKDGRSQTDDNTIEVWSLRNRQDGPVNTFRVLAWDGPLTDLYDPREMSLWQQMNAQGPPPYWDR
jgi:hypothetical protein